MRKDILYKPADASDIPAIFAFNKGLIDQYEDITSIEYDKVLSWVRNKIVSNIREYVSVYWCGKKAGYFRLVLQVEPELDDLYIFPEYRGNGIGTEVLRSCISGANKPLILYVFVRNTAAIRLYCIRRSPAAAGAVVNGSSAVTAAAV